MIIMNKKELHPKDYRFVVFSDEAAKFYQGKTCKKESNESSKS